MQAPSDTPKHRKLTSRFFSISLIAYLLLCPILLVSQSDTVSQQELVEKLVAYRSKVINEHLAGIKGLRKLELKWGKFDVDTEAFEDVLFYTLYGKKICGYSNRHILKKLHREYEAYMLQIGMTEDDVDIIAANGELLDMITAGVLKPSYPYILNTNTRICRELNFYGIGQEGKIGEIGAGNGTFSLILAMLRPKLQLTVNELNENLIEYFSRKFKNNQALIQASNIDIVEGHKKSTHMESGDYDKIIIRNTFHHFAKPGLMLRSVSKALKPTGYLYLNEPVIEKDPEGDSCDQLLPKAEVVGTIEEHGFRLVKEAPLGNRFLMKFERLP